MRVWSSVLLMAVIPGTSVAQSHQHDPGHLQAEASEALPHEAGQAAFAAISEVVRILNADPETDWSKVNLEALRQHLITMDAVLLRSRVTSTPVPAGIEVVARGDSLAIRSMLLSHARALDARPDLEAQAEAISGGARLRVTVENGDPTMVARIRGLGFAGLLVLDDHHARHHLMIARGLVPEGHTHEP